MARRSNNETDTEAIIAIIIALVGLAVAALIFLCRLIPPLYAFIVEHKETIGKIIAECCYPLTALVVSEMVYESLNVSANANLAEFTWLLLFIAYWIFIRTLILQAVSDVKPKKEEPVIEYKKVEKIVEVSETVSELVEKKQHTFKVKLATCSESDLLTLAGFNEEKAKSFIKRRKDGQMWYDIDTFVTDFNLQPHEMILIMERLEFPPKSVNKIGRTIEF